jgi:FtsZ-binding cell division protein ZapB
MFSSSAMSGDIAVLQDEVEEEQMTLSDAKQMLRWVLQNPDGSGLEELMMELPALLKRLQRQEINNEYWETCVIDLLTKIRHELRYLPSIQPGDLVKDLFLSNEAVDELENNNDNIVDIFSLLQQKEAPSSRKRPRVASTSCRTWSVRLIALLGRMACVGVGEEETLAWTAVEARVRGWIHSSISLLPHEINAGVVLAALDILDSARAQDAVVGHTRVTGLTPRLVVELLQKPGYVFFMYVVVLVE